MPKLQSGAAQQNCVTLHASYIGQLPATRIYACKQKVLSYAIYIFSVEDERFNFLKNAR